MPQHAVKLDAEPITTPHRPTRTESSTQPTLITLGEHDVAWAASPARQLHDRLLESFREPVRDSPMVLSRRKRLAILGGSVALLWSLIGATAIALLR